MNHLLTNNRPISFKAMNWPPSYIRCMVCAMLQAPTTYGSRPLVYLRSRLSLANLICSQATRQHSFVVLYSLLSRSFSVDFLHPFLYCPVLFPRILSTPFSIVLFFFRGFYPSHRNQTAKVIIIMQTSAKKANYY